MLCSQESFFVCYQRRKVLQKYLFFGSLSTPQRASELIFLSMMLKSAELFFMVSYQRRKVLQNSISLVSDQRHKVLQNNLFLFLVNVARCCRNFCGSLSTPQGGAELLFFMPQSASDILVFRFLSAPENALELLSFSFSSTLLSSAELLFLVFINAMKCCRITSY